MREPNSLPPTGGGVGRVFDEALGAELRAAREDLRWSRPRLARELSRQLGVTLTHPALAAYEYGARRPTVTRLVELCHVLGVPAPELLRRATGRVPPLSTTMVVDLRSIAWDGAVPWRSVHRWARASCRAHPEGVVRLTAAAVDAMAAAAGCDRGELVAYLRRHSPPGGSWDTAGHDRT